MLNYQRVSVFDGNLVGWKSSSLRQTMDESLYFNLKPCTVDVSAPPKFILDYDVMFKVLNLGRSVLFRSIVRK